MLIASNKMNIMSEFEHLRKVKAIYRFLIKETATLNVQPSNTFILRAVPFKYTWEGGTATYFRPPPPPPIKKKHPT